VKVQQIFQLLLITIAILKTIQKQMISKKIQHLPLLLLQFKTNHNPLIIQTYYQLQPTKVKVIVIATPIAIAIIIIIQLLLLLLQLKSIKTI
jgi:hypothetical protein